MQRAGPHTQDTTRQAEARLRTRTAGISFQVRNLQHLYVRMESITLFALPLLPRSPSLTLLPAHE